MKCLVTAGPTYEALDEARRLTNFSTGRLGSQLADFLAGKGHQVILLKGSHSTFQADNRVQETKIFATSTDLENRLREFGTQKVNAVFHAAAVSDFRFGRIWKKESEAQLVEICSGKLTSRNGPLLAELLPTPKLIASLRRWFPQACLVGWKFEVEGPEAHILAKAKQQMTDYRTNACVVNGPGHGPGFSLVSEVGSVLFCKNHAALFAALEQLALSGFDHSSIR